jgi:pyruvate/2-oxoglutarate dehydrogenase complex dihydrolipoamide acyltransferase (E2) component
MSKPLGYRAVPFTMNRLMVAAAAAVGNEQNTIHSITEVDITEPRRLIREHRQLTGEKLSLTAFVVACLARAVAENPNMNSFRKGRNLILLDDVTISVLVEREIAGENIPEPIGIRAAQTKTYRQIHEEIRSAQNKREGGLGALSGATWIRFIPGFLLRMFVRAASRSVYMAKRFGKVGVTAVGMFGSGALWFIPLSGATVVVTVGGIVERPAFIEGRLEEREFLCLTVSFNHDIVDGAPAARFVKRLEGLIKSGEALRDTVGAVHNTPN